MEWYERSKIVMSPSISVSDGDGYLFYLWTDEIQLIQAIMNQSCVVQVNWYGTGSTANQRQWAEKVGITVRGNDAWESITALLDDMILGEVWGQALEEILASDLQ